MSYFLLFIFFYLGITSNHYLFIKLSLGLLVLLTRYKKDRLFYIYIIFYILGLLIFLWLSFNKTYLNIGIVIQSKENYFIIQTLSGRYYVSCFNHNYEVLDILQVRGEVEEYFFQNFESQFNFNEYLKNNFIFFKINYDKIDIIFLSFVRPRQVVNNLKLSDDVEVQSFLKMLIFSYNDKVFDSSLIFENQLSYYYSLSSLYIYFFLTVFYKLGRIKIKKQLMDKLIIILIIFFVVFSNYKISIIRLLVFKLISLKNNNLPKIEKIGLVYLITSLININFLSINNILYTFPLHYLGIYLFEILKFNNLKNKIFITFSIFLFLIPINIFINGYFCPFSFAFALFISPYLLFLFLITLVFICFKFNFFIDIFTKVIITISKSFFEINIKLYPPNINIIFYIGYYLLFFSLIYYLSTKRLKLAKRQLYLLFTFLLINLIPTVNYNEKSIYFINVGQGDSILIRNGMKNYLIDTGGSNYCDIANDSLIPFFKKNAIYHLDGLFITHSDFDHSGGVDQLIKNFKVKQIYTNKNFYKLEELNFSMVNLNNYQKLWNDENDSSLVLYLKFMDKYFLFLGDISSKIGDKIVEDNPNLNVDYLKISHHGSKESTSEKMIKKYLPKEAIISVGINNYGHPSIEVINLLKKYQIVIRRTDQEGTIKYLIVK